MAAAALLFAAVAIGADTAPAGTASAGKSARIDAESRSVAFGKKVTLRGSFPGAAKAPLEILQRAKGTSEWRVRKSSRTNARGRYAVRVKPRRNGHWRARIAGQSAPAAPGEAVPASTAQDTGTGSERINVRSRTKAKLSGRHTRAGRKVTVRGRVRPAGAKRTVVVRIGGAREVTKAGHGGRFKLRWRVPATGSYPVRVKARSNRIATSSRDSAGRVTAYRPAAASWYGPGLFGNRMACGGTLTPSTMGVAHKTMPCGTKLRLRHGGRSVTVRVVDRGPFAGNREFDLTAATRQALRFGDVGTVLSSR